MTGVDWLVDGKKMVRIQKTSRFIMKVMWVQTSGASWKCSDEKNDFRTGRTRSLGKKVSCAMSKTKKSSKCLA